MRWDVVAAVVAAFGVASCDLGGGGKASDVDFTTRFIRVQGTHRTFAPCDTAKFAITVISSKPTSEQALNDAATKVLRVTSALKGFGPDVRLIGPKFQIAPYYALHDSTEYGMQQVQHPDKLQGYTAGIVYAVEVSNLALLPDLLSKIADIGVDGFKGIQYELRNSDSVTKAAYDEALAQAKLRAESYAKATGIGLGRLLRVDEGHVEIKTPEPRRNQFGGDDVEEIIVTAQRRTEKAGSLPANVKLPSEPPMEEVNAEVDAVFEIKG